MQKEDRLSALEQELKVKESELNKFKKGYEEFISLATHDLLSPVRKITTLLERFEQKTKGKIPEDAVTYLERMNKSVHIMTTMVENMTTLSLITPDEESTKQVDLNSLFRNLISGYNNLIENGSLSFTTEEFPDVSANKKQLEVFFKELMVNAIKFKNPEIKTEISVSSEKLTEEEKLIYDLSTDKVYLNIHFHDNGIGFRQEMAERIVKPFQRLHGNATYPGNGIGLAICKKIAEMNNGIFTAEGKENEGATFSIILPTFQN